MIYLKAFLFCGTICMIGQLIYDYTKMTPGHITSLFVCIGVLLEPFHIYDTLLEHFEAGAMLPITNFGHALMHGTANGIDENGLLGILTGMFEKTSAGLVFAIFTAFIMSLVFKSKS